MYSYSITRGVSGCSDLRSLAGYPRSTRATNLELVVERHLGLGAPTFIKNS